MAKAVDAAVAAIKEQSQKVNGTADIARVGTVSSGDENIGKLIAEAMEKVSADGVITKSVADKALLALEVDYLGLDNVDRRMLQAIIENYGGGPVGLDTLAATIGEESVTLEDVYEPYLMQIGFLTRTPRGRCVTQKAYAHLHIAFTGQQQLEL